MTPGPLVAAHRGGAALWSENSVEAVRQAIRLGVAFVEIDVHAAADGTPVVIHDATLERTTDGRGRVSEHPWDDLRRVRLRGPDGTLTAEHLPCLDEVLKVLGPSESELLLELKGPAAALHYESGPEGMRAVAGKRYDGLETRVLAALAAHGMTARATILAFNPAVLEVVRALAPAQLLMLLVSGGRLERTESGAAAAAAWAVAAGARAVGIEHAVVDAAVVAAARTAGLRIGVWTVNDEAAIRRVAGLGVDVITSDRPDLAMRLLGAR